MPRLPRASLEGVLYYITSFAMPNNRLFKNPEDYRTYLTLLRNNQTKFKLFAFLLQPDQITLLLELKPQASLSQVMHTINNSYTKYYNNQYGETHHLFKGRYESKIMERSYLLKAVDYIHSLCLNCRGAIHGARGLSQTTATPQKQGFNESNPYSSYPIYLGQQGSIPIQEEMKEVTNYLEPDETYEEHIKKIPEEETERLGHLLNKKRIIGSREFIGTIREKIEFSEKRVVAGFSLRTLKGAATKTKTLPKKLVFGVAGLILLSVFIYSSYHSEKKMRLARTQIDLLQKELELAEKTLQLARVPDYLDGSRWLVTLKSSSDTEAIKDEIIFKEKKVISKNLTKKGFSPTKYSVSFKENGLMIWESIQTNQEGQTVNWYGIYDGSTIKGVLSENIGSSNERIFSFVSVKKKLTESKDLMG